jgi:hypothetical protein
MNIDAGGAGLVASDGSVWAADSGFTGGKVNSTAHTITGADNSTVLRSYRFGMSAYSVPVTNGSYRVTILMAEPYWKAAGKRIFSATAEGVAVFSNLDLYAVAGHDVQVARTAVVTVKDGALSLAFKATANNSVISGLRVEPVTTSTTVAPSPDPTTKTPTPTTPAPITTTPAPTTTSPAPATTKPVSSAALKFSPPALVNPVTMAFPEGAASVVLDTTKDYVLTLPSGRALKNTHGLTITGGRNVVVIGGTVDVGDGVTGIRRAAYLSKATPAGTTYIEGVRFISSTQGSLTEGIDLASPGARVVLQNVAIGSPLAGSYATNHADAIQAWGGPAVLEVDGFTATTGYQGFFLLPNQHSTAAVQDWSLNRIQLTGTPSGYMLWRDSGTYAIDCTDVYVTGSHIANGGLWPNAAAWKGVTVGVAPTTFAATAGDGYVSPGYEG